MSLASHLESYLGPIETGWRKNADGVEMPFQVARFSNGSGDRTISFATVGLSGHVLGGKTKKIRQELLVIVPETLRDGPVPGILQQIGIAVLESHRALLRGDVLGPHGRLFHGSEMEAFYVSIPVYFPNDFSVCVQDGTEVVIVWLVPIFRSEANYVRAKGWREFEQHLAASDPDLTDIYREPLSI